jgi:hypothetical protein
MRPAAALLSSSWSTSDGCLVFGVVQWTHLLRLAECPLIDCPRRAAGCFRCISRVSSPVQRQATPVPARAHEFSMGPSIGLKVAAFVFLSYISSSCSQWHTSTCSSGRDYISSINEGSTSPAMNLATNFPHTLPGATWEKQSSAFSLSGSLLTPTPALDHEAAASVLVPVRSCSNSTCEVFEAACLEVQVVDM